MAPGTPGLGITAEAQRPRSIVYFERLFLFTILIGVVQAIAGWHELSRRGSTAEMLTMLLLSLGTLTGVALLVSRGRSPQAKWVLLVLLVVGVPMFLNSLERGTIVGWGGLALLQAALQIASVSLLFTRSARRWLSGSAA